MVMQPERVAKLKFTSLRAQAKSLLTNNLSLTISEMYIIELRHSNL